MTHRIHRVMRLVTMDCPVARLVGDEFVSTHATDRNIYGYFRPARFRSNPAAIGACHLEVVSMHVDRVIGHGQVANANPYPIALAHNQWINAGEGAAVPCPQVEIQHGADLWNIRTGFDVESVEKENEIAIDAVFSGIARMHDEEPHHTHGHLNHFVGMGMVHEGPALSEFELVDERLSRFDVRLRETANPVHAARQKLAMPMDRRMLGQPIGDKDANAVALHRLDRRTRALAIVAPQMRHHSRGNLANHRLRDQMEFLPAVFHPPRQGPAIKRDHRLVVRSGRGLQRWAHLRVGDTRRLRDRLRLHAATDRGGTQQGKAGCGYQVAAGKDHHGLLNLVAWSAGRTGRRSLGCLAWRTGTPANNRRTQFDFRQEKFAACGNRGNVYEYPLLRFGQ